MAAIGSPAAFVDGARMVDAGRCGGFDGEMKEEDCVGCKQRILSPQLACPHHCPINA